ncbi:hypothetical protein AGDE_16139 [Angomonas deanei]|nr:hypothetical protein AGDE_16139 [Angomonas deanei]|eukprot:EPY17647.1 hypothetical protein AGDE_16139 [Angomonas deanei]
MQNNIGLQNNGNTCFLNSTMQLIKSSDKFIESSINRFIYYSILANRPSHQPAKEDEDEESDNLTSIYNTLLGILDSEKLNRNRYGMFSYLSRFKSNNNNSNDEASNNVKTYTAFIFLMLEIHYRLYRHHHAAENAPAESADGLQSSSEEEEGSEEEGTPSIGGSCIVHSSAGTPTSPYFPILTRKMSESINNSSREALSPTPERKMKKKKKPEADHVLNKYRDPAIYMNPNYFVNVCPQPFCNGRQHDSSEFSKVLFDVIDMEEKKGIIAHMMNSEEGTSPDNDNAYAASVISSVYKYFGTVLLSEIKCLACQTVRRTNKEHMIDLVLPVLPKNTTPIEKINRTYTKEEEVEVEETEYITRPKETHIFEDDEGEEKKSEPAADSEKENTEDKSKTEESGEEKPAEKDTNDNIFYENESDISLDGEEGKNSVHETIVRKVTTTVTKHFVNKTKYTIFYDLQLLLFMQNDSLFNKELLSGDNKLECEKCKEKTDSLLFSRIVSNKITKEEEKEASSFSQLLSVEEKLFANDNHQSCPVYLTITLNINSNSISKNSSIINGNEIIFYLSPLT